MRAAKARARGSANRGAQVRPPPGDIAVALATLVDAAPEGDGWVHELKLDGYRMVCRIEHGKVSLFTRNGNEWTRRAPSVVRAAAELRVENAVLDGELVYLRADGITDFQALQNALRNDKSDTLIYFAFDLLYLNGEDTRSLSLLDRKALLAQLLSQRSDPGSLRLSEHVVGHGPEFFRKACKMGLEGVISKRGSTPYRSGRGRDWLKVKCTARQEMVIVGYTNPRGSRRHLGALLVATRDEKATLRYAGKVGTGFSQQALADVHRVLRAHQRAKPACVNAPKGSAARAATWVDPICVAEVEFTEFTSDGMMRHPSFRGLREDKPAGQILRERAKPLSIKATATKSRAKPGQRPIDDPRPRKLNSTQVKGSS